MHSKNKKAFEIEYLVLDLIKNVGKDRAGNEGGVLPPIGLSEKQREGSCRMAGPLAYAGDIVWRQSCNLTLVLPLTAAASPPP